MLSKKQKIHTRTINIATYKASEESIIVEGSLKDDRLFESLLSTGKKRPPGTYIVQFLGSTAYNHSLQSTQVLLFYS